MDRQKSLAFCFIEQLHPTKGADWSDVALEEVRDNIDRLDRVIIGLMAERSGFVKQAAQFKTSHQEVEAPKRVEQVIAKIREMAIKAGLEPQVAEAAYRAMIAAFIEVEYAAAERMTQRG